MQRFHIRMMVDQRCLAVMKYGNYDVEQDGMDNKVRKEWLLYGESGIAVCGIISLLKGH